MTNARDTARTRLAEIHRAADCPHAYNPCADCLADAILSAPGVQVSEEGVERLDVLGWIHSAYPTHTGAVIRLPPQPIGEGT